MNEARWVIALVTTKLSQLAQETADVAGVA